VEEVVPVEPEVEEEKVDLGHRFVDAIHNLWEDRADQQRAHRLLRGNAGVDDVPPLDRNYYETVIGYFKDHPRVFAVSLVVLASFAGTLLYWYKTREKEVYYGPKTLDDAIKLEGYKVTETEQTVLITRVMESDQVPILVSESPFFNEVVFHKDALVEGKSLEDDFHKPNLQGNVIGACVDVKPERVSVVSNCCDTVPPSPRLECVHASDCALSGGQDYPKCVGICNTMCGGHHCVHWKECTPHQVNLERHKKKKRDLPVSREYNPNARRGDVDFIEVAKDSPYCGAVHPRRARGIDAEDEDVYNADTLEHPDEEYDDDPYGDVNQRGGDYDEIEYKYAGDDYRYSNARYESKQPDWQTVKIANPGQQRPERKKDVRDGTAPNVPSPIQIMPTPPKKSKQEWEAYAKLCRRREKRQKEQNGGKWRKRKPCESKTEGGAFWCIDEKCDFYHMIPACPYKREGHQCPPNCFYYHKKETQKQPNATKGATVKAEGMYQNNSFEFEVPLQATFLLYKTATGSYEVDGLGHCTYHANTLLSNSHLAKGGCFVEIGEKRFLTDFYPALALDYSEARWTSEMGKPPKSPKRGDLKLGMEVGRVSLKPYKITTTGPVVLLPDDPLREVEYTCDSRNGHCGSGVYTMNGQLVGLHRADMQNGHNGFIRLPLRVGELIPKVKFKGPEKTFESVEQKEPLNLKGSVQLG